MTPGHGMVLTGNSSTPPRLHLPDTMRQHLMPQGLMARAVTMARELATTNPMPPNQLSMPIFPAKVGEMAMTLCSLAEIRQLEH